MINFFSNSNQKLKTDNLDITKIEIGDLPAEFYDLLFPLDIEEYNFYKYFLNLRPGKALELGCGTGNLLLKYRQEGFFVDGIDCSQDMLNISQRKMKIFDLGKQYLQKMEDLKLDFSYKTIYAPACVFMLIPDYDQAINSLRRFREHLEPDGQLIISLFLPFHELSSESTSKNNFSLWKDFFIDIKSENKVEESRVLIYESLKYEPVEQLRKGLYKYEIYKNNKLQETRIYEKNWRWYGIQEFKNILIGTGFKNIELYGDFTLEPASNNSYVIIFRAF
jgi:ubiquinone/menaquinone biosynthesis C-methylase UbiE